MSEASRKAFEAYMRKGNPCVRLARHNYVFGQYTDSTYRTTTVQRAWEQWQASRSALIDEASAAILAEKLDADATQTDSAKAYNTALTHAVEAVRRIP